MAERERRKIVIACPCCGARLTLDAELGTVIAHEVPAKHANVPDLNHAGRLLQKAEARREAIFKQSAEEQKVKSQVLERKFEESLEKAKHEPTVRPTRDIDLD